MMHCPRSESTWTRGSCACERDHSFGSHRCLSILRGTPNTRGCRLHGTLVPTQLGCYHVVVRTMLTNGFAFSLCVTFARITNCAYTDACDVDYFSTTSSISRTLVYIVRHLRANAHVKWIQQDVKALGKLTPSGSERAAGALSRCRIAWSRRRTAWITMMLYAVFASGATGGVPHVARG
jgi:hypothetical protein